MLFLCQTVVFCFCFALSSAGFGCGCCSGLLVVNGTFSRPGLSEGQFTFWLFEAGPHCVDQAGFEFVVVLLFLPPKH